ncbi:hypothetical protein PFISCL1PPCAC_6695, partial [Pristionchus fissidentatus]
LRVDEETTARAGNISVKLEDIKVEEPDDPETEQSSKRAKTSIDYQSLQQSVAGSSSGLRRPKVDVDTLSPEVKSAFIYRARAEIMRLSTEMQATREECTMKSNLLGQASGDIEQLQLQLKEKCELLAKANEEIAILKEQLEKTCSKVETDEKIAAMAEQLRDSKSEEATSIVQKENRELKEKVCELTNEIERLKEEGKVNIEKFKEKNDSLEAIMKNLERKQEQIIANM